MPGMVLVSHLSFTVLLNSWFVVEILQYTQCAAALQDDGQYGTEVLDDVWCNTGLLENA